MKHVLVDSGGWYALADRRDPDHRSAVSFLQNNTQPLITTNFVFDETVTLIRIRMGWTVAATFGRKLLQGGFVTLMSVRDEDEKRAWDIFLKFKDQDFSYTDCTSFAIMERLKMDAAFTFDRHFSVMGYRRLPA